MPVRKRSVKRRAAVDADEEAWLRGDYHCGFVEFRPWEKLEELWEVHGDKANYHRKRGMSRPELL